MKKLISLIALLFLTVSYSFASDVEMKEENPEDPGRICRYYAIIEASNDGYEYGSTAWQSSYLLHFNWCMEVI